MFGENAAEGDRLGFYFATIGAVSILGIDACTNQAIAGLIPDTSVILSEYLMYYMHTLKPYYSLKSRGVTQNNINKGILISVKIPVPPIEVQKTIVENINDRKSVFRELEKTKERSYGIIKNIINELIE